MARLKGHYRKSQLFVWPLGGAMVQCLHASEEQPGQFVLLKKETLHLLHQHYTVCYTNSYGSPPPIY